MTSNEPPITVAVPVYGGADDVRRCIESVLSTVSEGRTTSQLLVIDDASPDPAVEKYVRSLGQDPSHRVAIRALRNPSNYGFVGTVNRAFHESPGDVVVLNADTIVTPGWLDRLRDAALSRPDVATVTPLTNFGSLATLPAEVTDSFDLNGQDPDVAGAADFVEAASLRLRPEVISGVGFCMYVRREAIDAVGVLDERAFGKGYGEEVDFCLRAGRAGFVHLVEDATFVLHRGGGSFGDEREERLKAASTRLHSRYPFFRPANLAERRDDPLAPTFAAFKLALAPRDPDRPHVLYLMHSSPGATGGTEKHVAALRDSLSDSFDFSTLYPEESSFLLRTFWRGSEGPVEHEFLVPAAARKAEDVDDRNAGFALRCVLDLFDFDAVHIQNIIGYSLAPLRVLGDFDGPVVYSLRDQFLACPHHWLLYRNEEACGVPGDLGVCATCLPLTKQLPFEQLLEHRDAVREHVGMLDHIVVASENSADYLLRVYDIAPDRFEFIEHGTLAPTTERVDHVDVERIWREPLRVAFAGQGRKKKGIDIVQWLADEFREDEIEVHHFGEEYGETSANLITHGRYDNRWLPELLELSGMHVVLLPGQYAETFGHVMTESMLAGLPVIGVQYGALAERIYRYGVGWTIDPDDLTGIANLIRCLDRDRAELERVTRSVVGAPLRHTSETADRYADLYHSGGSTAERRNEMGDREERQRRQLRAMGLLNRQLRAAAASGQGQAEGGDSNRARQLEKTLRSRQREIDDLKEAYAESRKRARDAEQRYESLSSRKAVRAALSLARLTAPFRKD